MASPSASASPVADAAAKAKSDVLATYKAFIDYKTNALTSGKADPTLLSTVASGDGYKALAASIFKGQQLGIVYKGTAVSHPEVTAVNATASPKSATLTDCLDISDFQPVFAASGNSAAAPGQPTHVFYNATAVQTPDGTWRISQYAAEQGRAC